MSAARLLQLFFMAALVVIVPGAIYCQQQSPPATTLPPTPQTTPSPSTTAVPSSSTPQTTSSAGQANSPITIDNALRLAGAQVSSLQQAQLNEGVASEDVRQAQAAFLPKITSPIDYIYTSPALGL